MYRNGQNWNKATCDTKQNMVKWKSGKKPQEVKTGELRQDPDAFVDDETVS